MRPNTERIERIAQAKEAPPKLKASRHIQPESFTEGTLAAALERWLIEGEELFWSPDDQIATFALLYNLSLEVSLYEANNRRESLLKARD